VGDPKEALEETEPAQAVRGLLVIGSFQIIGNRFVPQRNKEDASLIRSRFERPSSPGRKRRRTFITQSGQMVAGTIERSNAADSCSSMKVQSISNRLVPHRNKEDASLRSRFERPSSPGRKRRNIFFTDSSKMVAGTNDERNKVTGSCSSVEDDSGGEDEGDPKPPPLTISVLIGSYPDQEVVRKEAAVPCKIPPCWNARFPIWGQ
jgi:hypothetical protein